MVEGVPLWSQFDKSSFLADSLLRIFNVSTFTIGLGFTQRRLLLIRVHTQYLPVSPRIVSSDL